MGRCQSMNNKYIKIKYEKIYKNKISINSVLTKIKNKQKKIYKISFHNTLNFSQNTYRNPSFFWILKIIYNWIYANCCINFSFDVHIKKFVRNSSSILLQSLILTIFITENTYFVVAVKTRWLSTNTITQKTS
jgi:hypothetical protein